MEVPDAPDAAFVDKKREELKIFFKDANFPEEVIDKVIENELKPLKHHQRRPYIAASCSGDIKSEYDVMTGQPFTSIADCTKPLTVEEIKEKLKDNPIIAEKARQIQIVTGTEEPRRVAVPLDQINIASYADMRTEIDSAEGDTDKVKKIHYKNMQALMNSVTDFQKSPTLKKVPEEAEKEEPDSDDKEFEAIEKVVSQFTDKSYETRYQETKDMLLKLADTYDNSGNEEISKDLIVRADVQTDKALKDSSIQLIKGEIRKSTFEEVKANYAINEAMNISLKDNPVTPDLSGKTKNPPKPDGKMKKEEILNVDDVFPKSMETKLKETEKALRDINSVLTKAENIPNTTESDSIVTEDKPKEESIVEVSENQAAIKEPQKFDAQMEQQLHNALEDIFETSRNENDDNKQMEFREMKNLARNIVEGAENLSTLIREDITNKLNSMNELLNDVNEALENSRKSNIVYQKIKEECDIRMKGRAITAVKETDEEAENKEQGDTEYDEKDTKKDDATSSVSSVTDSNIDDINSAIKKLNAELLCHEERINKSKENYELRNNECKVFIQEVDDILKKSKDILHPTKASFEEMKKASANIEASTSNGAKSDNAEEKQETAKKEINSDVKKQRKELWDIEFNYKDERNKRLAEYKTRELDRNKRINDLLYDIKDKMKDNKDVLRLANNMLRREEGRKKTLLDNTKNVSIVEVDAKAQGDHVRTINEEKVSSEVSPSDGDTQGKIKKY